LWLAKGDYRYGSDYSIFVIMSKRTPPGCGGASPTSLLGGPILIAPPQPGDVLEPPSKVSAKYSHPGIYRMSLFIFP
jgi:hypothetical protein